MYGVLANPLNISTGYRRTLTKGKKVKTSGSSKRKGKNNKTFQARFNLSRKK
jgi:hypothetical protein